MAIKKIGVLTSGGDAPGMNAAIRAVVRMGISSGLEVYGIHDGYYGMYEGNIERLYRKSVSEKMGLGGTFLGTARLPEFTDEAVREVAIQNLRKYGIDALVAIGGDGTYQGALALSKMGLPVVGLPGTIDNDVHGTDFTIGFDTALNTVVDAVDKLRDTSNSHHRCSIVEVMGRNCGDLALWAALSTGAEVCITRETGYNEEEVVANINEAAKSKKHAIIIAAEHMLDVHQLEETITNRTPFKARATILGYVQRGGSPTPRDRVLASTMGVKAVEALLDGKTHHCIASVDGQLRVLSFEEALTIPNTPLEEKYEIFRKLW